MTYDWALTETMPEDRPSLEQIENDELFDNWIQDYERKMAQKTAKHIRKK